MKREQVRAMMPILQAFVDGKEIEGRPKGFSNDFECWMSVDEISGLDSIEYRIKPEQKYLPFKNAEECWNEMLKHQPFGWVKTDSGYEQIWHVNEGDDFNATFKYSTFADGTPFGVKKEE